jgi:hypothetical protein
MAAAQSLSPMRKEGATPTEIKGFKLQVGNPYPKAMIFVVVPMDPAFEMLVDGAVARPAEFKLAAGMSRTVTVAFKIGPESKERTIGVCVMPKGIEGPVLPRVCGTYTGIAIGPRTGG